MEMDGGDFNIAPDGISLRYLISNFYNHCKDAGLDWSMPSTNEEWRKRMQTACYVNATCKEEYVQDGHKYIPQLFEGPGSCSGLFARRPASIISVIDRKSGDIYDINTYRGELDRSTVVVAVPIDMSNSKRKDLMFRATLEELCILYTRDLVHYYIGNSYFSGVTSDKKCTLLQYCKERDASEEGEDIGPASMFISHAWCDNFCDTIDCLLPSDDECYRAMTEPSFDRSIYGSILLVIYIVIVVFVPCIGWVLFPYLGRRSYVIDHIANPRWWTPKAVIALGKSRLWIDIFCKNQHGIDSIEYKGDTSIELRECVRGCGETILACSPWQDPTCLRRIWCQFEVHHTNSAHIPLRVRFPLGEKLKMDRSMYSWIELIRWIGGYAPSHAAAIRLGDALLALTVCNARATIDSDKTTILTQIARDFGGNINQPLTSIDNIEALNKADLLIRLAAIDGVTRILGGATPNMKLGERRPRQLPWSLRVAIYTFIAQLWIVLIVLISYHSISPIVLLFLAGLCLLALSTTFINMSAKSHQLVLLLQQANFSSDARTTVFIRERGLFLWCFVISFCGSILCILFCFI